MNQEIFSGKVDKEHTNNIEVLAHDLRSPLNSIAGLVEILRLELKEVDNEYVSKCLDLIEENCQHSHALLSRVLEIARQNYSTTQIQKKPVNINELLTKIVKRHEINAISKGINLHLDIPKSEITTQADDTLLSNAVENLLSNALKFTDSSGYVELKLYRENENIFIVVRDNGVGIKKEMLPQIFDKFTKAGRNGLRGEESVGLGMSITRQIVEAHNGEILVQSEEKKGTTFIVKLPHS